MLSIKQSVDCVSVDTRSRRDIGETRERIPGAQTVLMSFNKNKKSWRRKRGHHETCVVMKIKNENS